MKITFARAPGYGLFLKENGFNTINGRNINPVKDYGLIWRWGFYGPIGNVCFAESANCINKANSMKAVSNKYLFLEKSKNEIRVPEVYKFSDKAKEAVCIHNKTVLGRKNNHFGGTDIKVFSSGSDESLFLDSDYWVEYIPKDREFRIYTFFGKVLEIQEKFPGDKNEISWNHSRGAIFAVLNWNNWPSKACFMALKASELYDLDFCAWDIILGKNHKFYILEGNTAPAITSGYGLEILGDCVGYLSDYYDKNKKLPEKPHLGEFVVGYKNYIHSLLEERC